MRSLLCALTLALSTAGLAAADVFSLKDGSKIEGSLVRETTTAYVVKTANGEKTVEKSQVASVQKQGSPKDEYDQKLKGIKANDAEGFYQLGLWCDQNKMKPEALRAFKRVLEIEPQHEAAHKALGHVQFKGAWMTPGERDALEKKDAQNEQKAAGKVLHKGQWVTAEEKANLEKGLVKVGEEWMTPEDKAKLDKGLVKVDGSWLTPEEKDARDKGLYKVEGKFVSKEEANAYHSEWEKAWEVKTEHYLIRSNKDVDYVNEVAVLAEKVYAALKEFYTLEPKLKEPMKVFVLKNVDEYNQFANNFARGEEGFHSSGMGCFLAINHPEAPAVSYYHKDEAYNYVWTNQWLYHVLPHQYQTEILPNLTSPWLVEGIATYFELFKFYKVEMKRYRKMLVGERFIKLDDLMKVESLSDNESSGFVIGEKPQPIEAGMLILFLIQDGPKSHKEDFQKFFQKMVKTSNDTQTFEKTFSPKKLEKEFQTWIEGLQ